MLHLMILLFSSGCLKYARSLHYNVHFLVFQNWIISWAIPTVKLQVTITKMLYHCIGSITKKQQKQFAERRPPVQAPASYPC